MVVVFVSFFDIPAWSCSKIQIFLSDDTNRTFSCIQLFAFSCPRDLSVREVYSILGSAVSVRRFGCRAPAIVARSHFTSR